MNMELRFFRIPPTVLAAALACALSAPAPVLAATFTVDSTADSVDANPGDGICADASLKCTLRAAVMEANRHAGADTIDLSGISNPADPIILTIKGADETYEAASGGGSGYVAVATHDASIGDLNIIGDTTISGAGSDKTIIEWSLADQADASGDRIFHIEAVDANISVTISGLTVENGVTPPVVNINQDPEDPTANYWQFKRHGGCIATGVSAATSLFDPTVTHGGGSGGRGGGGGSGSSGGHGGPGGEGESGFAVDSVTLNDVHVINCLSGGDGGGIYNAAPLTLADSIVSGGTAASNGGGIYTSAVLTISNTTLGTIGAFTTPNHAENGGGIFDTGLHTTTIGASAIVGNTATGGGALAARSTTIDNIENTTISGNVARDTAGGLTTNGRVNLKNVTLAGNQVVPTSDSEEGGAGVGLSVFASGQFTYVNTIIANNTVTTASGSTLSNCGSTGESSTAQTLVSSGHNLEDGDSCNLTASGDLKNTDPQLKALTGNGGPTESMAIPGTSPALDAGDNSVCPNNDQRGEIRPADGNLDGTFICDIGAFELFVHTADIHLNGMTAPDQVFTMDPITVTIEAHNDPTATTVAQSVVISTKALPADFTVTSAKIKTPGGTANCSVASQVVTCNVGNLGVGDSATATIVGTDAQPDVLSITGKVSATSPLDPIPGNNSSQVNIQVLGRADMGVTASGSTTPVQAGTDTDFTFTVTNHGPNTATAARFAAFLPEGLTYKSITISKGSCTYSPDDASVTCDIGSLANGASVTGTLTTTATANGTVEVLFGADSVEQDADAANDAFIASVEITGYSDLKLGMHFAEDSVEEGGTVPILLTVSNLGPSDTTHVQIVSTLPAGLKYASSSAMSKCKASGNTVTCTLSSLRAGNSEVVSYFLTDKSIGTHTVNGTVTSDLTDPVSENNSASAEIATTSSTTNGGSSSGGGCAYRPNSPFDPTLPALFLAGLLGLAVRSLRKHPSMRV